MYLVSDNGITEVPAIDIQGFFCGIGTQETIKISWNEEKHAVRIEYLADHYRKILFGIEKLGLQCAFSLRTLETSISQIVTKYNVKEGAIFVIVAATSFPKAQVYINYVPIVYTKEAYQNGFKLTLAKTRINPHSPTCSISTISNIDNMLDYYQAKKDGFDEVVHLNIDGYIASGSLSNIFWQTNRGLYTPSLECGVIPGVVRQHVINSYRARGYIIHEGMYELNDLYSSDRIFLTNSLLGEMPAYFSNKR